MKRSVFPIVLFALLFIFLIANFSINEDLERKYLEIGNEKVDIFCEVDEDCTLSVPSKLLECLPCDSLGCNLYDVSDAEVIAVNKNWNPDCPEPENSDELVCAHCAGGISSEKTYTSPRCINWICQK